MRLWMLLASLAVCCLHPAFGATQLITDGGFESGGAGWVSAGLGAQVFNNGSISHSGSAYLAMGRINSADQAVFQSITIPSNAISASLTFFYNIYSGDTINPSLDTLNVAIVTN